jgi:hypothetical protein
MRKLIAATIVGLLASSAVLFAQDTEPTVSPTITAGMRDAMRVTSVRYEFRQAVPQTAPPETKPWIERHPVWFGLIAGASAGAAWGALSCHDGCFPIGPGGAAMVGSWFGAGPGALIGWAVGRAK